MNESREQFIEFAKEEGLSLQTGYSGYVNLNTQLTLRAWDMAWQASRSAIEIDLSDMNLLLCDQNDVVTELNKHGLKVKVNK